MASLNPAALTADCQPLSSGNEDLYSSVGKQLDDIRRTSKEIKGSITRYILQTTTIIYGERLTRERFGEEDKSKPHKTILMVGETGTGKSTLINTFINHMLGVQWENRVWCEIIETRKDQTDSQTKAVTVYDVFIEEFPFSLTVIDTPRYGSTEGKKKDLNVTETLHELFRSKDGVHEIDAVCLAATSNTTRLTGRQLYVFDAVLSLFGKDVEKNIVLLITRAPKKPTSALRAIKDSKVKCAKTKAGDLECFWFDSSHCEDFNEKEHGKEENDEEEEEYKETAWNKNEKHMRDLFAFLQHSETKSLKMTESVLRTRKQLTAAVSNLRDRITLTELKKKELEQTKAALKEHEKEKKDMNDFQYEVDEPYKEKVPIDSAWWHLTKEATCCTVCKENCHYPDCWWVRDLSWCSVMKKGKCTVCTGRCDHTKHVKEGTVYDVKTRKVKKSFEDLMNKYKEKSGEKMSLRSRLENEIKEQEKHKEILLEECYHCVFTLDAIALKTDSKSVLQHLDFLIEKVKETSNTGKVQRLEELKKRCAVETNLEFD
ncbi:uncharacterized protein [Hoplias malabaricus]|uniref:uncharacterized protein n=1 Tax=Hoplias malabaricus TaxID=27720 RepID=UPI00346244CC